MELHNKFSGSLEPKEHGKNIGGGTIFKETFFSQNLAKGNNFCKIFKGDMRVKAMLMKFSCLFWPV